MRQIETQGTPIENQTRDGIVETISDEDGTPYKNDLGAIIAVMVTTIHGYDNRFPSSSAPSNLVDW